VIPTFGWSSSATKGGATSERHGNGLRVYMNRPWYSSGDGEQLGVVLFDPASSADPTSQDVQHLITIAGQDPAWSSAGVPLTPDTTKFPLSDNPVTGGLALEERQDFTVGVAPHNVTFDNDRGLWYSDIVADLGRAYMPFIRLALARYQASSVNPGKSNDPFDPSFERDVSLSRVVQAQFAQLNPSRSLSVVFDQLNSALVHVAVSGPTYAPVKYSQISGTPKGQPATVQVLVQTQDPRLTGDLAWTTKGGPVTLSIQMHSDNTATWTGDVTLPSARGSQPFRLVVQEFENYTSGGKLIYADAVEI
jgi:hypothetical protein